MQKNNLKSICDIATEKELNEIKEIVTVIINDRFYDLIDTLDEGYPEHEELRINAKREWDKNRNFDRFILYIISKNTTLRAFF